MAIPLVGGLLAGAWAAISIRAWWVAFLYLTPKLVLWVLVSLGIGFVTYQGTDVVINYAISQLQVRFSELPVQTYGLLDYMGVFKGINIVASGITAGLTVRYGTGNRVRKFKFYA